MAHSDDATKAWVSATPVVDGDSKVISWNCKYRYTLAVSGKDDFVHTFDKTVEIEPTKAIQELSAENEELKTRITALENA